MHIDILTYIYIYICIYVFSHIYINAGTPGGNINKWAVEDQGISDTSACGHLHFSCWHHVGSKHSAAQLHKVRTSLHLLCVCRTRCYSMPCVSTIFRSEDKDSLSMSDLYKLVAWPAKWRLTVANTPQRWHNQTGVCFAACSFSYLLAGCICNESCVCQLQRFWSTGRVWGLAEPVRAYEWYDCWLVQYQLLHHCRSLSVQTVLDVHECLIIIIVNITADRRLCVIHSKSNWTTFQHWCTVLTAYALPELMVTYRTWLYIPPWLARTERNILSCQAE